MSDELTNLEINQKLAQHFEPKPTFKDGNSYSNGRDCLSDKGYWWCEQHHRFDGQARHPINIIDNPGLVQMMMVQSSISVQIEVRDDCIDGRGSYCAYILETEISVLGRAIGIAVALAYIKKEGL